MVGRDAARIDGHRANIVGKVGRDKAMVKLAQAQVLPGVLQVQPQLPAAAHVPQQAFGAPAPGPLWRQAGPVVHAVAVFGHVGIDAQFLHLRLRALGAQHEVDREGLLAFYQRYGFRSWRKELEESLGRPVAFLGTPEEVARASTSNAERLFGL